MRHRSFCSKLKPSPHHPLMFVFRNKGSLNCNLASYLNEIKALMRVPSVIVYVDDNDFEQRWIDAQNKYHAIHLRLSEKSSE